MRMWERENIELENNKLTHRLHFIAYQLVVDSFVRKNNTLSEIFIKIL